MSQPQADFGLIGLAVMGENLALNVESRGDEALMRAKTAELLELIGGTPG